MRSLRPILILTIAGGLSGLVFALSFLFAGAGAGAGVARGIAIFFGVGALIGVIVVAPIAAAELLLRRGTRPHAEVSVRLDSYTSMLMGLAMGYALASMHHHVFDLLTGAALAVIFVGTLLKTFLHTLYRAG
ncbi:MAG TPA: hypothetical protein VH370_27255 [Humisphaera sp.]|nr:hypothetical protein [Humisphaera sp.]